ncbi:AraC family transcriptional regulator [Paenibacillus psychroresistens]|uniref:AraC family transcriptional regulator n=1 Tax=Paenibacillus psychroresistens TaxID=1778678 RepID=A0A6B8RQV9_9BACL|nr:AraC family transcriptional regulator [Paenibacillus psychroresistens]QGQ98194.1 AraC family transcriptional regulator [Paenibacillus psychroresistens]
MDLNNLSPYIRVALDDYIESPYFIKERVIFDYELLFVKAGEIKVTVENKTYLGLPGDIFLFKPMQSHSIYLLNNKTLHQPHIHFDLYYQSDSPEVNVSFKPLQAMNEQEKQWFREDVTQFEMNPLPNHIRLTKPAVIEKLIYDIIFELERKFPYYEASAKGLFTSLWIQLLREHDWNTHKYLLSNWEQLDRIKNYISHNANKELTLNELSSFANLSKYYLCRLFKSGFGMSPIQYHLQVRMEKAKQMIQFSSHSLTYIAEEFGFHSIHAFSRAFRKLEGVSPSSFRKVKN